MISNGASMLFDSFHLSLAMDHTLKLKKGKVLYCSVLHPGSPWRFLKLAAHQQTD